MGNISLEEFVDDLVIHGGNGTAPARERGGSWVSTLSKIWLRLIG